MSRTLSAVLSVLFVFGLMILSGCGDDKSTTSPATTTNPLQIADLQSMIERVAPPEYTAPSAMPMTIDSVWYTGTTPLLEVVFGSEQPQALYTNIAQFKQTLDIISGTMRVDADGHLVTGVYVDSHMIDMGDGEEMAHFTATVTALAEPTPIPQIEQALMGTTVDVDYLISVVVDEQPGMTSNIGISLNGDQQTVFQFDAFEAEGEDLETRLTYASLNTADSSFVFKGLMYCLHPNGEMFNCAFDISSQSTADFAYRVSWYSNGSIDTDILNCLLGGGNKDVEYALKYRMYAPADTSEYSSTDQYDQVFGPNYTEGTGLISNYADYLDDALILTYDIVPQAMMPNPWGQR